MSIKPKPIEQKSKDFLLFIVFLQFTFDITVLAGIPVAKQVIGFFYLTFIPGFIILMLLKLDELSCLEIVLLSVGFSIAVIMLLGIILNIFGPIFGISRPLTSIPILITLNVLIFSCAFVSYIKGSSVNILINSEQNFVKLTLILFPLILSIVGAMIVNLHGNSLVLLLTILILSIMTIVTFIVKSIQKNFYPYVVFVIAVSLLFHSSLISNYLVGFGSDAHVEHLIFQKTKNDAFWSLNNPYDGVGLGRLNSMLSITILPTFYSNLLNIESTWVFKIIFPLIFSLVPLCLYQIWQEYVNKKYAFASAFLFMAQETFYTEMLGLNRQMVAELFFVLLLLILVNKRIKYGKKFMCFAIFSFALITSHYGLAEIFLFFISIVSISLIILKRSSKNITVGMVIFFFVMAFIWYIYTSNASVFESIIEYGDYVYNQLGNFFNPTSRGQTVLQGLGMESPPTIWNAVSRTFAYFTEALIVIGFFGLIVKRVKPNFDREFYAFTSIAMGFLGALILVPGLAQTLNMTRFYHVLLFFFAPLCILGAEVVITTISKQKKFFWTSVLLICVLIPYFLFQTSFVYEVVGSQSWSLPLSMNRLGIRLHVGFAYVKEEEVLGAKWLSKHINVENSSLFADFHIFSALVGYGLINEINRLTNVTIPKKDSFIYFGTLNTIYSLIIDYDAWNTTQVLDSNFGFSDKLYSNGECEIYKFVSP